MTIDDIAERLAVSRTSVYGWVRDLPFDANTAKRSKAQQRAAKANSRAAAARRDEARRQGIAEFDTLAEDSSFRDFVCIYIAEGYKRNRHTVSVANSDLAVIKLADRWIRAWSTNPVSYEVQFHADQSVNALRIFWGQHLCVNPSSIRVLRKSNSGQLAARTWRSRYGVLTVRTCDTLFRARLGGWIARMRQDWL